MSYPIYPQNHDLAQSISQATHFHPYIAQILINRGIQTPDEALRFLRADFPSMMHSMDLEGMPRTIALLQELIAHDEPILIFGDSDCDGVLSSLILYETLEAVGGKVAIKLANRINLGYGLSDEVLEGIVESNAKCVILIDCGTNQHATMQTLAEHGIESIIIDHHIPMEGPPTSSAWVNPHCVESTQGRELCSVGLAFKIAQVLCSDRPDLLEEFLALAAIGTLADCSPLIGDSRIIVKQGLPKIELTRRSGLLRLMGSVNLKKVTPDTVLKKLVPRINAMGRLGDPTSIWQLLHETERSKQETWFDKVKEGHESLKQMAKRIAAQAIEQINRIHFKDHHVLVVGREGWHAGLMGPLASQLSSRYNRPTVAIALGEETGTGSARSLPHINLLGLIQKCESHLVKYGGHEQACGVTLKVDRFEAFQKELNEHAKVLSEEQKHSKNPSKPCDLECGIEDIKENWVQEMDVLKPWGQGNRPARILIRNVWIKKSSPRRGWVGNDFLTLPLKGTLPDSEETDRFDLAVNPQWEKSEIKLQLLELKLCEASAQPCQSEYSSCKP